MLTSKLNVLQGEMEKVYRDIGNLENSKLDKRVGTN